MPSCGHPKSTKGSLPVFACLFVWLLLDLYEEPWAQAAGALIGMFLQLGCVHMLLH